MEIKYFDISHLQNSLFENSASVHPDELIDRAREENPEVFEQEDFLNPEESIEDVESSAKVHFQDDIKRGMASLIYSLSGQVPSERERNLIFSSTHELQNYFDDTEEADFLESQDFVFGALPYFFSGFGVKDQKWSRNDVNSQENFISTVSHFLDQDEPEISSFLCAQKRQREGDAEQALTGEVYRNGQSRAFNLLKGISSHMPVETAQVTFYHPTATYEGLISIFPKIITETAERGELGDVTDLLRSQSEDFARIARENSEDFVEFETDSIDDHVQSVYGEMERRIGSDYRELSTSELESLADEEYLFEVARNSTLPEVERLMPFYKEPGSEEEIVDSEVIDEVEDPEMKRALQFYTEPMSKASKAVAETVFYYKWGEMARDEEGIAIGLERDHEDFQTLAFQYGHGRDYKLNHHAPLLYARRSNVDEPGETLHKTSLRQFWRDLE